MCVLVGGWGAGSEKGDKDSFLVHQLYICHILINSYPELCKYNVEATLYLRHVSAGLCFPI